MNTGSSNDDDLLRAWRAAAPEEPPRARDDRILESARAAAQPNVTRFPTRRDRTRWPSYLAAAAVAGLAFTLVQTLPREPRPESGQRQPQSLLPVPTPEASPGAPTDAPHDAEQSIEYEAIGPTRGPDAKAAAPEVAQQRPLPVATDATSPSTQSPPVPAPAAAGLGAVEDRSEAPAAPSAIAKESVAAPAAETARIPMTGSAEPAPDVPGIVDAYDRGDFVEAARELRRLRIITPNADAMLPERLQTWARTVR